MTTSGRFRASPWRFVFEGQSMFVVPSGGNGVPGLVMAGHTASLWANVAVSGTSLTALATTAATRVDTQAGHSLDTALIISAGYTDIGSEDDSGATLYADHVAYAAARTGFGLIFATTLIRATTFDATENTNRINFNTLLLADASNAFDGVADWASDPTLADYTNTAVLFDGVHFTNEAAIIAAGLVTAIPALDAILAV